MIWFVQSFGIDSVSHIMSMITFSHSTNTSAPALSMFELISSIPATVSILVCFNVLKSYVCEIGLDRFLTTFGAKEIVGGISSLYALSSTTASFLADFAKYSFHLLILLSDELIIVIPSSSFKFVEVLIFEVLISFNIFKIDLPRPCLSDFSVIFSASSALFSHHVSVAFLQAIFVFDFAC